jgi:hypothetical protein
LLERTLLCCRGLALDQLPVDGWIDGELRPNCDPAGDIRQEDVRVQAI